MRCNSFEQRMWLEDFLRSLAAERNCSPKTVQAYADDLNRFAAYFKSVDEGINWETVDPDVIRGWMIQLMDDGAKPTSVNRRLSAIRSFYTFLMKRELVKVNPATKVKGPKVPKALPTFLKETETEQLMLRELYPEGFEGDRDYAIICTFYETGVRLAELTGLDQQDVDFHMGVLKVTGKRNKQRLIPFGPNLRAVWETYMKSRTERFGVDNPAFFLNLKGERLERSRIENLVYHYLSEVTTQKKRSPHVLRHTFATQMLNHDGDLQAVKELLGHSSIATTEIYTHTTFEELKKVYKKAHPRS